MQRLRVYAEPISSEHASWVAYTAGLSPNRPGLPLGEVLERNGNRYEETVEFSETFRRRLPELALHTQDEELRQLAETGYVTVSLEHLRGMVPTTLITLGCELNVTPEKSAQLGWNVPPVAPESC